MAAFLAACALSMVKVRAMLASSMVILFLLVSVIVSGSVVLDDGDVGGGGAQLGPALASGAQIARLEGLGDRILAPDDQRVALVIARAAVDTQRGVSQSV